MCLYTYIDAFVFCVILSVGRTHCDSLEKYQLEVVIGCCYVLHLMIAYQDGFGYIVSKWMLLGVEVYECEFLRSYSIQGFVGHTGNSDSLDNVILVHRDR